MKDTKIRVEGNDMYLRLIQTTDKDLYYAAGFEKADKEIDYYTGTTSVFTKEMTDKYIDKIVDDESRYDFLIFNKMEQLLGEAVINDINMDSRISSFRVAIFNSKQLNKGIGTQATNLVIRFAFETLKIHRIELEVYDYNLRAKHVYEKVGFVQEGVKRDALYLENQYHDVIIMSMLETDYNSKR